MKAHLGAIAVLAIIAINNPAWSQVLTAEEARAHEARVQRAYDDVGVGDPKERVLEIAGKPGIATPATATDDEMWVYFSGRHMDVSLSFKDGKVTHKAMRFINVKGTDVAAPRLGY